MKASLFRIPISASTSNGLEVDSFAMIDKLSIVRRAAVGEPLGTVSGADLQRLEGALRHWLDL